MGADEILDLVPTLAFGALIISLAVYKVIGTKCPNCAKRKAIHSTGEERPSEISGVKTEARWACRACGENGWSQKIRWWTLTP